MLVKFLKTENAGFRHMLMRENGEGAGKGEELSNYDEGEGEMEGRLGGGILECSAVVREVQQGCKGMLNLTS